MKILNFDIYLDGGTIHIKTDEGEFCINNKLQSKNKGKLPTLVGALTLEAQPIAFGVGG